MSLEPDGVAAPPAAAMRAPPGLGRKATLVLASQVAGSLMGFLILLVIGRYFEPTAYGLFVFAGGSLSVLTLLADLGFGAAHVHFVGRGTDVARALGVYARIRLALTALLGILVLLAGLVWLVLLGKTLTDATTLPIVGAVLATQAVLLVRNIALDTWVGKERVNRSELAKGCETFLVLLFLASVGLALGAGQGRWTPAGPVAAWLARLLGTASHPWGAAQAGLALALAYLAAKALSVLPVAWWWRSDRVRLGPWDPALARQYAAYAIPIALAGAATMLLAYTDIVMLGYLKTATEVGQYGMAQKIAGVGMVAAAALATPLLPRFSLLLRSGQGGQARETLHRAERYLLLVGVPCSVGLLVLAAPVLHIAVGDRFLDAAAPLRLLALATLIGTAASPGNVKVMGSGRSRAAMVATFIAVATNAALNLWLIPDWGLGLGATGAAVATLVSTVAGTVYMRLLLRREFQVPLLDAVFARMALAGLGLGLFWWVALRWAGPDAFARFWQLGLWGAAGLAVFAALAALLGLLRRGDVRAIARLVSPRSLWRELHGR